MHHTAVTASGSPATGPPLADPPVLPSSPAKGRSGPASAPAGTTRVSDQPAGPAVPRCPRVQFVKSRSLRSRYVSIVLSLSGCLLLFLAGTALETSWEEVRAFSRSHGCRPVSRE